ncbi:hypothetical protein CLAFUW4_13588 [Fulvia fulva]|uniref:Uncharacterized protein n=1 Tax=Passalora fulva TaxID=5499 RepID=A0A9Q8UW52_PASFU|nr:uncharacterized protein CLAFUR5_13439 [Fulvia fulva]KAK4610631.1 hypothetical protein CLAFUR4_13591 [Fulvia fulva]UJO24625.1 hypothetical protein CLAFUR5_13439 [Fulvia fulva]WPV22093.1 hypothetical protein CLAFUW4_13588 [Fulvia fulva]WPV37076.1 hypothetical protein CLAFUW7_13596 [Fulvia fulva]
MFIECSSDAPEVVVSVDPVRPSYSPLSQVAQPSEVPARVSSSPLPLPPGHSPIATPTIQTQRRLDFSLPPAPPVDTPFDTQKEWDEQFLDEETEYESEEQEQDLPEYPQTYDPVEDALQRDSRRWTTQSEPQYISSNITSDSTEDDLNRGCMGLVQNMRTRSQAAEEDALESQLQAQEQQQRQTPHTGGHQVSKKARSAPKKGLPIYPTPVASSAKKGDTAEAIQQAAQQAPQQPPQQPRVTLKLGGKQPAQQRKRPTPSTQGKQPPTRSKKARKTQNSSKRLGEQPQKRMDQIEPETQSQQPSTKVADLQATPAASTPVPAAPIAAVTPAPSATPTAAAIREPIRVKTTLTFMSKELPAPTRVFNGDPLQIQQLFDSNEEIVRKYAQAKGMHYHMQDRSGKLIAQRHGQKEQQDDFPLDDIDGWHEHLLLLLPVYTKHTVTIQIIEKWNNQALHDLLSSPLLLSNESFEESSPPASQLPNKKKSTQANMAIVNQFETITQMRNDY